MDHVEIQLAFPASEMALLALLNWNVIYSPDTLIMKIVEMTSVFKFSPVL